MFRSSRFWIFSIILLISVAGIAGFTTSDRYFYIKKNFTIFSEVYEEVADSYVEDVDPEQLMRTGIDAMLDKLDPYTVLVDEAESERMDVMTRGQYAGVGLEVGARDGKIVVIAPIEGYSAHQKGVRAGDIIVEVDGISTDGMTAEDLQGLLRGEPDSEVELVVERYGMEQQVMFELTRETIDVTNVNYADVLSGEGDERIGYIVLNRFAQNAAEEIREKLSEMQQEEELDGLVLDLRNNPGGLLNEAVNVMDLFLEPGVEIVSTSGRNSNNNNTYESSEPASFGDKPLAVIQNSGSASASEIVSGAVQDLDRGVVIGERSFGKGLVQVVRPLSYNMALKMTTSKYYTPSGRSIQSLEFAREEDSEEAEISDEDREPFETAGGRVVYESIGIAPDVEVSEREESMVEIALLRGSHYFFFANQFYSENEEYEELTGEIFEEFQVYLEEESFEFETRAQKHYQEFAANLDDELKERSSSQLASLEEVIAEEQQKQFERYEPEIRAELHEELISRFRGEDGRMAVSVANDEVISTAVEHLSDVSKYHALLEVE